jgi:hypothetical protein
MLKPYSDIACLGLPHFRHTNYRGYANYFKPYLQEAIDVERLETICLVRHPLSWLYSWYRYRSGQQFQGNNGNGKQISTAEISFSQFIESCVSPNPPPFAQVGSQFDFVKNSQAEVGVDVLFQYEDINAFVNYMNHKVGQKLTIPSLNISPRKHYQSALMRNVDRLQRKVIRQFNLVPSVSIETIQSEIPADLRQELEKVMACDFDLYARVGRQAAILKQVG